MIGDRSYAGGRPTTAEYSFPSAMDSMDAVTYFYYPPQTASECGWDKTPTGVISRITSSSVPSRGTVVGCTKSHRGIAGGCAA
eukprot:8940194-Pyramimonas_sp.AAC.1